MSIDVNEAFAAERSAQVARIEDLRSDEGQARYIAEQTARFDARVKSGELVRLSEGRYQSTQGWDRGEIWTVQSSVNGETLVLPEHGLDINEKTGKARLFTAVPAWHGLGQQAAGCDSVDDVITLGQLDVPAVSVPVPDYEVPGVAGKHKASGQFIVSNGNTGEFWGIVGKTHRNLPIRDSFAFLQNIVNDQRVVWESAGLMGGGRKVFISCEVPEGVTVDANGVNDYVRLFLVVQDVRDGSGSYLGMVTPWRPLCQNTNRFALRDAVAVTRLRHTTNLADRIEQARQALGLTVSYSRAFGEEETLLARTACKQAEFESLMAELFAETAKDAGGRAFADRKREDESLRTRNANDRREDDLLERWAVESDRVGDTLYAAEQAYTGHLDWGKVRKGTDAAAKWQARIEASLAGDDDAAKTRGHARMLELVKR
jgi:phage/plasmid-like protein (TIGR03299 family)